MDPGPDHPEPELPRPVEHEHWRDRLTIWRDQLLDQAALRPRPATQSHEPADSSRSPARALRPLVGALLMVALVAGMWATTRRPGPSTRVDPLLPTVDTTAAAGIAPSPTTAPAVVVHVAGAVVAPGLVELRDGARVADALEAAGGPTDAADMDRVNLALFVRDQDRVFVPVIGQPLPAPVEPPRSDEGGRVGPINVNTASAAELESLPGVGPAIAAAIVEHRANHGPFATIAGLESVAGIGPSKLAQLRDLVTLAP